MDQFHETEPKKRKHGFRRLETRNVNQQSEHLSEAANNTKQPSATTKQHQKNQQEEDITKSRKRTGLVTTLARRVTVLEKSEMRACVVIWGSEGSVELAGEVGIRCVTLGK